MGILNLGHLTDAALLSETKKLVRQEREFLTTILHHLKEVQRRRLFAAIGYSSLFTYAVEQLGYSEDQAFRRISAMRLLKELPQLENKIQNGTLSLTNLGLAQSLFRKETSFSENRKVEVLKKMENKTSREAKKIVLSYSSAPASFTAEKMRQISPDTVELKLTITEDQRKKIERLKGLIAHSEPNISLANLIDKLCDLGIQKWDPASKTARKNLIKKTPLSLKSPAAPKVIVPKSRIGKIITRPLKPTNASPPQNQMPLASPRLTISATDKRRVWQRAKSQCENCGSPYALQVDHHRPRALGGGNELSNLRLLCRNCNQRAAIEAFSNRQMDLYLD